jgi:hypothetical protein
MLPISFAADISKMCMDAKAAKDAELYMLSTHMSYVQID